MADEIFDELSPGDRESSEEQGSPERVMAAAAPFQRHFSEKSFRDKILSVFFQAGRRLIEEALALYAMLRDPAVPDWAKAIILGALGYFILPTDVIPDVLPGLGYTDDLGLLTGAITAVGRFMTTEHRAWARHQAARVFDGRSGDQDKSAPDDL
ncbi:MAG TPA: YkvA family protein [Candidatus Hydrogenedentes bacterium]|nr:YkvA family protein [Candidatus Hydrogenedentota bacterium]